MATDVLCMHTPARSGSNGVVPYLRGRDGSGWQGSSRGNHALANLHCCDRGAAGGKGDGRCVQQHLQSTAQRLTTRGYGTTEPSCEAPRFVRLVAAGASRARSRGLRCAFTRVRESARRCEEVRHREGCFKAQ